MAVYGGLQLTFDKTGLNLYDLKTLIDSSILDSLKKELLKQVKMNEQIDKRVVFEYIKTSQ